jgi:hypothetical protein
MLKKEGPEVLTVGKKSGDFQVDIADRESVRKLYQKIGAFDAVADVPRSVQHAHRDL